MTNRARESWKKLQQQKNRVTISQSAGNAGTEIVAAVQLRENEDGTVDEHSFVLPLPGDDLYEVGVPDGGIQLFLKPFQHEGVAA